MFQTLTFSPEDMTISERDGYAIVSMNGALTTMAVGKPALPMFSFNLLIPPGSEISSVEVVTAERLTVAERITVYPAQPFRPLTLAGTGLPGFVLPEEETYGRDADYPGMLAEVIPSGSKSGYRLAGLLIYPVQYNPVSGRLQLCTRLVLRVTFRDNVHAVATITPSQAEIFADEVQKLVLNPEKVKSWSPSIQVRDGEVDYVIITPASLSSAWSPLVQHRRRQGLNAIVMPTETIYARYPGVDNQARIRAFIRDYWQNRGLKWVVLGGDHALVPTRYGYLPYSTYNVPADVYYADLDWSWDSNGNGQYGEMTGDTLDLFGDVYIGRIPCDNTTHINTFIAKDTIYELHPDTAYLKKIFLPWEWLWPNIGHGGFLVNNNIKTIMPADWQASVVGNCVPAQTVDSLNRGQHFMHFAGHGSYDAFGSALLLSNVAQLTNMASRRLSIINSMACYCGEFDDLECLGEALINAANGGAVAAMLNARYGWGAPPNMGPGEHFSQEFYRRWALLPTVGQVCGSVKDYFRNISMSQMTYRWTTYVLTTFGDPAMPMFTQPPENLTLVYPESVPAGPQTIPVSVADNTGPVAGATVTWLTGNRVLATGKTNSQGRAELFVTPEVNDTLILWVSARDYLPASGVVTVQEGFPRPCIVFTSVFVSDLGNHRLDPGETASVFVTVKNQGDVLADSVIGILRTTCPFVTILDSLSFYGALAPGDTARGDQYLAAVALDCPAGTRAEFLLTVQGADSTVRWTSCFELTIGARPFTGAYFATHDTGNFILSITGLGSIGSTGWRAEGLGMIWPKNYPLSATRLMLGSLVLGTDTSYVCDRFYHPNFPANDSDFMMIDSVRPVIPPERADEEFVTTFSDAAHRNAKNLEITLHSYVLCRPTNNNWAILEYTINNRDTVPVESLVVGFFADFKMTGWNMNDSFDIAAAESAYRMAYVYTGDTACLGVRLLYPQMLRGISVIDGYSYLQRSGMMSDVMKDSFLQGKKVVMNGPTARNWACMVSTGPFTLYPDWPQRVAFAIVGGRGRAALRVNSDSAQTWYDANTGIAQEQPRAIPAAQRIQIQPTTFRSAVTILLPPGLQPVTIDAFDAAGRLIERIAGGGPTAEREIRWQPGKLRPGVYFLKADDQLIKIIRIE